MSDDRIDQAATLINNVMHTGDGGNQARQLLAFDANTMGRADYNAVVQQVSTSEAIQINDLMRQGRHDDALCRLREDANIFLSHEQFMGLAGEVRAMNKATGAPTHLEFNPIYQNGDVLGRPTAVEVDMATRYRSPQTGQEWEKRDVVARVDNHIGPEVQALPPQQVVVVEAPPPPPPVVIGERNNPGFSFNLEIEIGRERVRRHDPRWCPDNDWRPQNAPPGFRLDIEINKTRDYYRSRGDNDWSPKRPTNQTIINQINNTTIINNTTNNRNETTNIDKSRTRINNEAPQQPQQQRRESPRSEQQRPQQRSESQQRTDAQPQRHDSSNDQRREAEHRRNEAQQKRDAAQQRREQNRDDDENKRRERKKN